MGIAVAHGTTHGTPGGCKLSGEVSRGSCGFKADLPMGVSQGLSLGHRRAMLLQRLRQGIKCQGWNGIVLHLEVVGEDEAGHNIQNISGTLAINEPDNEWLFQACRDRRRYIVHQRRAGSAQ